MTITALQRDPLAPNYEIIINKTNKLSDELLGYIQDVKVEDDADLFDKITITISPIAINKSGIAKDIIDSKIFAPGNLIEVNAGYGKKLDNLGAGYIVKPKPNFGRDGIDFTIVAYDPFFKMSQKKPKKKARTFQKLRDSQIVTTIGSAHDFDISKVRKASGMNDRCQPLNMNDYEFLKKIADDRGFDFYNRWDPKKKKFVLYFEPSTDRQKEILTFEYFDDQPESGTLLDFAPELSVVDQSTEIEIISWDRKSKKKISTVFKPGDLKSGDDIKFQGKKSEKSLPTEPKARTIRYKAFGENKEVITTRPFENEEDAKNYIRAHLRKRMEGFISGTAHTVGLEFLQSRQKHFFKGLGNLYDGKYYFSKVTHILGQNSFYECEIVARRAVEEIGD